MHANDALEALERLVFEIDAIASIICDDFDIISNDDALQHRDFIVTTPDSLSQAREQLKDIANGSSSNVNLIDMKRIVVEIYVSSSNHSTADRVRLRISLPPGYPSHVAAEVTVLLSPKNVSKSCLDDLSVRLSNKTKEMIGCEVMMEVINECRDALDAWQANRAILSAANVVKNCEEDSLHRISRRWIWVHHITNIGRIKQIVHEAQQLNLGGYVKVGYPGVVIIEGPSHACDNFVTWIKGNKSRPGGFGRNWGHHVRGEITTKTRQLPETFCELEDDMGSLGGLCKSFDLEEEFREYILQHK